MGLDSTDAGSLHAPSHWTTPKPQCVRHPPGHRPGVPTHGAPILGLQSAGSRHGHHTPLPSFPWRCYCPGSRRSLRQLRNRPGARPPHRAPPAGQETLVPALWFCSCRCNQEFWQSLTGAQRSPEEEGTGSRLPLCHFLMGLAHGKPGETQIIFHYKLHVLLSRKLRVFACSAIKGPE